jgi:hypothetical protein
MAFGQSYAIDEINYYAEMMGIPQNSTEYFNLLNAAGISPDEVYWGGAVAYPPEFDDPIDYQALADQAQAAIDQLPHEDLGQQLLDSADEALQAMKLDEAIWETSSQVNPLPVGSLKVDTSLSPEEVSARTDPGSVKAPGLQTGNKLGGLVSAASGLLGGSGGGSSFPIGSQGTKTQGALSNLSPISTKLASSASSFSWGPLLLIGAGIVAVRALIKK